MRDHLLDLVQHTLDLGVIDLSKSQATTKKLLLLAWQKIGQLW